MQMMQNQRLLASRIKRRGGPGSTNPVRDGDLLIGVPLRTPNLSSRYCSSKSTEEAPGMSVGNESGAAERIVLLIQGLPEIM